MRRRASIRLTGFDYEFPASYFVTICVKQRRCLLGAIAEHRVRLTGIGRLAEECLQAIPEHYPEIGVDCSIVMPNHIHAVLVPGRRGDIYVAPTRGRGDRTVALRTVVGTYKAAVSRLSGNRDLWQRGYYDHVIRGERDLDAIRTYVANNPIRWALDRENPQRDRSRHPV